MALRYSRFSIPDGVIASTSDDGTLVLNMETDEVFGLNPVAYAFWDAINVHDGDAKHVIATLLARFEVDAKRLEADLDALAATMIALGLLDAE